MMKGMHVGRKIGCAVALLAFAAAEPALGASAAAREDEQAPIVVATAILPSESPDESETRAESKDTAEIMTLLGNHEYDKALQAAKKLADAKPEIPVGFDLIGRAYAGKGDYASARKSFEKALALQKDYAPATMNLAFLDMQQKKFPDARKRYEAVLAQDPKNVRAMIGLARVEDATNHEKESVGWLEKAKAADPDDAAPVLLLALRDLRSGNPKGAVATLNDFYGRHPDDPRVTSLLGEAQLANGQKTDAIATYRKLVAAQPKSPIAYFQLAGAQESANDPSGAEESLKQALVLKPDYLDATIALASLQVRAGRYDDALKLARQVQRQMPQAPAGLALEGDVLLAQKRYADAVESYRKSLAVRETAIVAVKLHMAQSQAGNEKEADATLQQWIRNHPEEMSARLYLAGELARRGQNKPAIELYEAVLKKQPQTLLALNNLANLYVGVNDKRALEMAEAAYKLKSDSPVTADTLGWILVQQGKTERGLALLKRAVADDPRNSELRYHLAVALAKSGDKAQARQELEKLLATPEQFPQREAAQAMLKQF